MLKVRLLAFRLGLGRYFCQQGEAAESWKSDLGLCDLSLLASDSFRCLIDFLHQIISLLEDPLLRCNALLIDQALKLLATRHIALQ